MTNKYKKIVFFIVFFLLLIVLHSLFVADNPAYTIETSNNKNIIEIKEPLKPKYNQNNFIITNSNENTYKISKLNYTKHAIVLPDIGYSETTGIKSFSDYWFQFVYTLKVNEPVNNLEFIVPLPINIKEQQYISDLTITPKPNIIEKGQYLSSITYIAKDSNNISAKYIIPYLDSDLKIIVEGKVKTRTYNLETAKKLNRNISPETLSSLQKYLEPQKDIESNDTYIINIAEKIQGKTQEEILENIYKYIQTNMNYKLTDCIGAKQAIIKKYGKCCDYAAVMAAMARAKGIPSRVVSGKVVDRKSTTHNWVEIYYDKYGWVTYDPAVSPANKYIHDKNGKLIRTDKIYDVSPNVKYLKIASDSFVNHIIKYSFYKNNNSVEVNVDTRAYPADY